MRSRRKATLLQAAALISSYARSLWEGEVERAGRHKGRVMDERARKDIAGHRRLVGELRRMARK